jgi:heme o synthase
MNSSISTNWSHRCAILLVIATLALIFIGGLVTSTHSGLSVPDWPLSYGRLMPRMVGGILFEHGHRMVAATVGFFTIVLALVFTFRESRGWIKKAAWGAVGLVIAQGVLGGLTVLLRLPKPISIIHACTAQTFFCLVVALAVWTSSTWNQPPVLRTEPEGKIPLHQVALTLFLAGFIQLILGAVIRHTGWGVQLHIIGAGVVVFLSIWLFRLAWRPDNQEHVFRKLSTLIVGIIFLQIILGLSTYFLVGSHFKVTPFPFWATAIVTSHVMTGAAVLGCSLVIALLSYRTRPANSIPLQTKLSDYYELSKPGISFMAGITALAGFVLGSNGTINFLQLFHTGIGTLLVAGAAGTLNMLIEKDIDAQMNRTKKRPLPSGRMNPGEALFIGSLLAVSGLIYLGWIVNLLTALVAGLTLSIYLYIYTPLKKVSSLCTTFGAIAGALPPVMGWTAATGHLGLGGWILFAILFFWQFPHFFALAWLYKDDYARAGLHMLPRLEDNGTTTAVSIVVNSVLLLIASVLPTYFGFTGKIYLYTALALGLWILYGSIKFLVDHSYQRAKLVFFASIAYVPILMIALALSLAS